MVECTDEYDVVDFVGRSYYRVIYCFYGNKRPRAKFFDTIEQVQQFEEENQYRLQRLTVELNFYKIVRHYKKEEANE